MEEIHLVFCNQALVVRTNVAQDSLAVIASANSF